MSGNMNIDYYKMPGGLSAIDICRHLSFNLGNVVKYAVRAGRKVQENEDATEAALRDLRKAQDYLQDEINKLENGKDKTTSKDSRVCGIRRRV